MAEPRKVCLRAVAIQELHRPPGRPNQPLRLPPASALHKETGPTKFSRRTGGKYRHISSDPSCNVAIVRP
jgi:hypothetical protein